MLPANFGNSQKPETAAGATHTYTHTERWNIIVFNIHNLFQDAPSEPEREREPVFASVWLCVISSVCFSTLETPGSLTISSSSSSSVPKRSELWNPAQETYGKISLQLWRRVYLPSKKKQETFKLFWNSLTRFIIETAAVLGKPFGGEAPPFKFCPLPAERGQAMATEVKIQFLSKFSS